MEDVQINALAIGPREPAPTAHAAAVVQDCPPVDAVTVPRCSAGPRSDSPPLRMRVPPNARLGSSKRQRVAATEVDETEPAVVAVPVAIVEPGAPSQPPQERPRYLSVAAAATETGLPKAVVKSWAAQGFMDTLKPGSDNSHRLVEMGDLLRFVALKRELARTDMRKKLEEEQAERLAADSKSSDEEEQRRDRALVYVRVDENLADREARLDRDKEELTPQQIHEINVQLQQLGNTMGFPDRKTSMTVGEMGSAYDLSREGFDAVVTHILQRTIDRLVIFRPSQVCSAGAWPLFKWLCDSFDVAIVCAEST